MMEGAGAADLPGGERAGQLRVHLLLVAALAACVYINTLPNAFVIDDRAQVLENQFLKQPGGWKTIFSSDVWGFFGREAASNYYRPLMYAVWRVVWPLSGEQPAGYHAANIAAHALVSALVLLWLRAVGAGGFIALLAALLFAVHPIHTEAVGWVSALPELLCALFVMAGLWVSERGNAGGVSTGAGSAAVWGRAAGVGACALLALLSKETGIVLPFLLLAALAADWRRREGNSEWREPVVLAGAALAGAAVYLFLRWNALGGLLPESMGVRLPAWQMLAGAFALLYEYTALVVAPWNPRSFHVVPVPSGFADARVVAGVAIAGGLVVLGWRLWRRGRREWFGLLFYVAAVAPSFLAPVRENGFWLGERYLYLPSVGFCWLLAAGISCVRMRNARAAVAVAVVVLGMYAARSVTRNLDWRDEITFYEKELRAEGESPQLRPLLAEAWLRRARPREAYEHATAWARIAPADPRALNMAAFVAWTGGDRERAFEAYRAAIRLAEERGEKGYAARALNNLAVAYTQSGSSEQAMEAYRRAIALDPGFASARNNLGALLYESGAVAEAADQFRAAVREQPSYAEAHSNLGLALLALGDVAGARRHLDEALKLGPDDAEAMARLGDVERRAGNAAVAAEWYRRALALDPENARARSGSQVQ